MIENQFIILETRPHGEASVDTAMATCSRPWGRGACVGSLQLPLPPSSSRPLVPSAKERGIGAVIWPWSKGRVLPLGPAALRQQGGGLRHPLNPMQWAEVGGLERGFPGRFCAVKT